MSRDELKHMGIRWAAMREFVLKHLRPDGVLLLYHIRQHVGGRIVSFLT